jgi:hypothetical protein
MAKAQGADPVAGAGATFGASLGFMPPAPPPQRHRSRLGHIPLKKMMGYGLLLTWRASW